MNKSELAKKIAGIQANKWSVFGNFKSGSVETYILAAILDYELQCQEQSKEENNEQNDCSCRK